MAPTKQYDPGDIAAFLQLLPDRVAGLRLQHALDVRHPSFMCIDYLALAPALPMIGLASMESRMDDWIGHLQWPAMAVTVTASWLVASSDAGRRHIGFWLFLVSNVLWAAWGWHTSATALIVLQFALAAMNIRGAKKTDPTEAAEPKARA